MVGLIKNKEKVPFISLGEFIDYDKLNLSLTELEEYRIKQENGLSDVIIGYKGDDWNSPEFMSRVYTELPRTTEYIMSFCENLPEFNVLYTPENDNFLLIHQDLSPFPCQPWSSLIPRYKHFLTNSYHQLLLNPKDFKITDDINKINPIYNGLDYDFYGDLIKSKNYEKVIKDSYKLHLILSDTKTLFVYDNVTDTIYEFNSKAAVFNARDFHDSFLPSWGYSIQFPMTPYFLKKEILEYCELN